MKHRIRSAAIIFNEKNEILLVKHVHPNTKYTWWVPPGGGIENEDENIFECAKREAFEETGLSIDLEKIVYIREFKDIENNNYNIEIFILSNRYSGNITTDNIHGKGKDDQFIKEVKWFNKNEIENITVFPEIIKNKIWDDKYNNFDKIQYIGKQEG